MIDTKHTVSRGRPRGFDPDRGVEVAAELFAARGYDTVGIKELTDAIGIRAPSFYAAYGSKAGLLARVLSHYVQTDGGFLDDVLAAGGPPHVVADRLFARAAETYANAAGQGGCLVMESTRNCGDAEACTLMRDAQRATRDRIRDWIASEAPARAEMLADYVMAGLAGLSQRARAGTNSADLAMIAGKLAAGLRSELAVSASPALTAPRRKGSSGSRRPSR